MEYDVEKLSNKIRNERFAKKVFKYIILSLLMFFFIVNLILSFEENTHILGIYVFNIISESMEPTLNVDDLIVVQKCKDSQLKKGDIVTFNEDGRTVSHRIFNIIEERGIKKFQTKGDNNKVVDPDLVEISQIYGKVIFSIKKVGKLVSYIQNIRGLINIVIFTIMLYIIVSLKDKQKNLRKIKRKKYEIKKKRDNYNI